MSDLASDFVSPSSVRPETGLGGFYRDYFDALRDYLIRRLNCPEAGCEAAQDIFLRLLSKPPTAPIDNPRGFLFKVARNFIIDLGRKRRGQAIWVPLEEQEEMLLDPLSDPARIAEARQRLDALAKTLQSLPPKCREVFFLHRFEGLSQAETAKRLGISSKMVEKHMVSAMLHLRRRWVD